MKGAIEERTIREGTALIDQVMTEQAWFGKRLIDVECIEVSRSAWQTIYETARREPTPHDIPDGATLFGIPLVEVPGVNGLWAHVRGRWPRQFG